MVYHHKGLDPLYTNMASSIISSIRHVLESHCGLYTQCIENAPLGTSLVGVEIRSTLSLGSVVIPQSYIDTVTQKTLSMLSALRKNDFYLIG